jgi:threonine dehydratase
MILTLDDVHAAAARIADHLAVTPTVSAPRLSALTGCHLHLKLETQHTTGSFKERGR